MGEPMDIKPTFVSTPKGDELVIMTRAHYDQLVVAFERSVRETADDLAQGNAQDTALAESRHDDWAAAGKPSIPLAVIRRVRAGDSYLKAMRVYRNLTQTQLSNMAGITQSYLSEIESGQRPLNTATAHVLAQALEFHPVFLSDAAPLPQTTGQATT